MNRHILLSNSTLSRRSVLGRAATAGTAMAFGGRIGITLAQEATPSSGPVEFLWETRGDPASPLGNPSHLAVAPDGNIWVVDGDNNRFQIIAPDGSFVETWGTKGSGDGQFDFRTFGWGGNDQGAIAFAPDGTFYVADPGNERVQKFGPEREFITTWGSKGIEPGQFITPIDLVVDKQGHVIVLDSYRNSTDFDSNAGAVQIFDADGEFLTEWGSYGTKPGQIAGPFGIGLDAEGRFLIAEWDNSRLQRFTPEGDLLDAIGRRGFGDGQYAYPMDAAVDAQGRLFVPDYSNPRVLVFDNDGRFLTVWGKYGSGPGEFNSALGVAVGADGVVYVSDEGRRLQAFRVGDLPEPAADEEAAVGEVAVSITDYAFAPDMLEIAAGTTVTWTNEDAAPHTVTADDGLFESSVLADEGGTFSFTFDEPGTYTYRCNIHLNMRATIVIT